MPFPLAKSAARVANIAKWLPSLSLLACAVGCGVRAQADSDTPSLIFPVAQGARWEDSFGAPRVGHTHQGEDLMAPKLRPLVACFDGTVTIHRNQGTAGNWITLHGSNGWRAEYMHLNNDTPGTNDGLGGDRYAFAPGLKNGDFVQAGQFLGYVGNSGNAEYTASHCHFELHGPNGVVNPAAILRLARVVPTPQIVGLAVAPTVPDAAPLRVFGTVLTLFPDQGEAMVRVTNVAEVGGKSTVLNPPRVKRLIFGNSGGTTGFAGFGDLAVGSVVTAEGKDLGRGRPLRVGRMTTGGQTLLPAASPALPDVTAATASAVTVARPAALPKPRPLPETYTLDGFDSGIYQGWHMDGDCWGHAPDPAYGSRGRIPGTTGAYFLSTAHARLGDSRISSGTGVALSPEFPLTHTKLRFAIGGGDYPGECCLNLRIDGQIVRTETGNGTDRLTLVEWDISEFVGKKAQLEIVDSRVFGERSYLLLDAIEMTGLPPTPAPPAADTESDEPTLAETAPDPVAPRPISAAVAAPAAPVAPDGASPQAFVLLPDGTRVEGTHLLTLEATGYGPTDNGVWGDRTALGTRVGFGTVAVDPRVIPLHTHLWVEGYGFCIALDTGGAIKGNRIDLGHETEAEALQEGRRKRRVLVLD